MKITLKGVNLKTHPCLAVFHLHNNHFKKCHSKSNRCFHFVTHSLDLEKVKFRSNVRAKKAGCRLIKLRTEHANEPTVKITPTGHTGNYQINRKKD